MNDILQCEIRDLEAARLEMLAFYRDQLQAYHDLKRSAEKVNWSDARYDAFVDSMNTVGKALAQILQTLSDGNEVLILTEMLELSQEYLENEKNFPMI